MMGKFNDRFRAADSIRYVYEIHQDTDSLHVHVALCPRTTRGQYIGCSTALVRHQDTRGPDQLSPHLLSAGKQVLGANFRLGAKTGRRTFRSGRLRQDHLLPGLNSSQVTALRNTETADAILLQPLDSGIASFRTPPTAFVNAKLCHLLRRFGFKCRGDRDTTAPTWVLTFEAEENLPRGERFRFGTTWWSLVLLSAQIQAPRFHTAWGKLYRFSLYAYIRFGGYSTEKAKDLTQGFFVEDKTLAPVDPLKGRLLSFLLGSLQNYPANGAGRNRCPEGGEGLEFISLDLQDTQEWPKVEPIDSLTPEKVFAVRRPLTLLKYAIHQNMSAFERLKAFLDTVNIKDLLWYEQAAAALQVSVVAVKTLIHRLHKEYLALVRSEIEHTVSSRGDIDAEIHELCAALMEAERRIMP